MYIVVVNVVRTSLSECLSFFGVELCVEKMYCMYCMYCKMYETTSP